MISWHCRMLAFFLDFLKLHTQSSHSLACPSTVQRSGVHCTAAADILDMVNQGEGFGRP